MADIPYPAQYSRPVEFCEWPGCRCLKGHDGPHRTSAELANQVIAQHEQYIEELESKLGSVTKEMQAAKKRMWELGKDCDTWSDKHAALESRLSSVLEIARIGFGSSQLTHTKAALQKIAEIVSQEPHPLDSVGEGQ